MRKSATNRDVLSTRDAAEQLGVALRTVQLWVEHGVLPAWKTAGGHRRISRAAVEKLLSERHAALNGSVSMPTKPVASVPPAGLKVLLVESDADELHLLAVVIRSWALPIQIATATNGFEALLKVGESCPDLLLTALEVPGLDGLGIIGALQLVGPLYQHLKIVLVHGSTAEEIERRGPVPAHVQVFSKPLSFGSLQGVMRDLLMQRASAAAG